MSTVVAIETPTEVAIAGDTRVADDGSVSSEQFQRVFDVRGVDAVVGAHDDDGGASLRGVAVDGCVLDSDEVALGTGSESADRIEAGVRRFEDEEEEADR